MSIPFGIIDNYPEPEKNENPKEPEFTIMDVVLIFLVPIAYFAVFVVFLCVPLIVSLFTNSVWIILISAFISWGILLIINVLMNE